MADAIPWNGRTIEVPGQYDGLPIEVYHGDCCIGPSVSSSGLRTIFLQSPAHYFVNSPYNRKRVPEKETEAFILGRACHHLLLGEDDFSLRFIMRPEEIEGEPWHTNKKICRRWLAQQAEAGRTVLLPSQIAAIRGMAEALNAHPLIQSGILNGRIEQSLICRDEETGVWLKARPDAIPTATCLDYADLKTTIEIGGKLDRSVSDYRYDMQAALTGICVREIFGIEMESFSLVFVEKEPPHCVDVLTLQKADIERAELDLRVALKTFAWCLDTGNWFGPSGTQMDARYVSISDWQRENAGFRRDFLEREIAKSAEPPAMGML